MKHLVAYKKTICFLGFLIWQNRLIQFHILSIPLVNKIRYLSKIAGFFATRKINFFVLRHRLFLFLLFLCVFRRFNVLRSDISDLLTVNCALRFSFKQQNLYGLAQFIQLRLLIKFNTIYLLSMFPYISITTAHRSDNKATRTQAFSPGVSLDKKCEISACGNLFLRMRNKSQKSTRF